MSRYNHASISSRSVVVVMSFQKARVDPPYLRAARYSLGFVALFPSFLLWCAIALKNRFARS